MWYSRIIAALLPLLCTVASFAGGGPAYSVAGFFPEEGTGRSVSCMNRGWLFFKGDVPGAYTPDFDDSSWTGVSFPHGIEYLPEEASGCINYQGPVWYRKHFVPSGDLAGKRTFLHFEAVMGKCKVWVNGLLVAEHYGGYLPVIADVSEALVPGRENVVAVMADNSDDPLVPPGKPQKALDFAYFGGIYRDCWLISHGKVYITDPNFEDEVAGGGVSVSFRDVSAASAGISVRVHVRNAGESGFRGKVRCRLCSRDGKVLLDRAVPMRLGKGDAGYAVLELDVPAPRLWSPEDPYLHRLETTVEDSGGMPVDGFVQKVGIRSVEFRGTGGFFLNGRKYEGKLIGANRHQDFAVIGNALPNSLHWRDALKLRRAGMKVIRNTHYPQDPAFMDACDSLGLFVVVNTPGWQFWPDDPVFARRVYSDIRNMVRRDRNRPSVLMWEPVLNETAYPPEFAVNAVRCVKEEYPYPGCYTASDSGAAGQEHFDVLYSHPVEEMDPERCYFTREWGDNVDDWSAHNSSSRVHLSWGEIPQLIQAEHYACPPYSFTCYDRLCATPDQHVGGCLWHATDHQRGYHPDPFYGGIMDAFRQPKYSYYMFMSQRPSGQGAGPGSGPMVHIAHQMTPFSPGDVTVYSNCDEVRLTVFKDGKQYRAVRDTASRDGMPCPPLVFRDAFSFMDCKALARSGRQNEVYMLAEGFVDGEKVVSHKVSPALRPEKIVLRVDDEGMPLVADGSDMVVVVAGIADRNGNIKRLNNSWIRFSIEGEGEIAGPDVRQTAWGTAPVLVRSTGKPGRIRVRASMLHPGLQTPEDAEIVITTCAPGMRME